MPLAERVRAVRSSVGLSRPDHVYRIRLSGAGAFDAAGRVFSRELYVRDGQIVQGLLLREDGTVFADCQVANDEQDFLFFAEGPDAAELHAYFDAHVGGISDLEISDGSETTRVIGVDGPYSWELMAQLVGPEIIGLPYLTFFYLDDVMCCRGGKTGEYGYVLVGEPDRIDSLWSELRALGEPLDAVPIDLETLDLCALENWFFNIRGEGRHALSPIELQLQWRVSRKKEFVGSTALERIREAGIGRRLTCLVSPAEIADGDPVRRDGADIGRLVHAAHSPILDAWVGLALIDLPFAHPGVDALAVGASTGGRTVTPPVIANRSLYVNAQIHTYASRHDDDFPPLVRS